SWLGMGGDGHIASLFPNTDPRADDPRRIRHLTPDPLPPEAPFDRVTLTIPALLDSDALLFVIRGDDKRAVFEAAVRGASDLPVGRLLAAAQQHVTCFTCSRRRCTARSTAWRIGHGGSGGRCASRSGRVCWSWHSTSAGAFCWYGIPTARTYGRYRAAG